MIVHMQRDIVEPEGAFGAFFAQQATERDIVPAIKQLAADGRTAGATIVYLRIAWQPGYPDLVANSPLLNMVKDMGCLIDGTAGADIVSDLSPHTADLVITHTRPGGFTASTLDTVLRSRGITTLAFAGVATNASVEGTARQASDLGYHTLVVEDACSAADPSAHTSSVESLRLLTDIVQAHDLTNGLSDEVHA
ncbi:cysteine hydrolase family protein [Williamsia limnetica]|uniref:cysteine hydrolase family protein n=1 Tax=Williamsia limnetica TaxID=882452 RepID=UPI001FEAFFF1|nr:isochorismatase family cysteine hydrolase [Williamsia limnetica]